ncbi:hypothetical protein CANINC_005049 [Pichia inconspicua]|uniref:RNA helicase n=1 Tax=Pichia inconspicua TaxID=52247 RepID=A0A4T0WUA1_9ASCO|nr:hypothetical protein CANINC_005049 [[Candida] inconspicua]
MSRQYRGGYNRRGRSTYRAHDYHYNYNYDYVPETYETPYNQGYPQNYRQGHQSQYYQQGQYQQGQYQQGQYQQGQYQQGQYQQEYNRPSPPYLTTQYNSPQAISPQANSPQANSPLHNPPQANSLQYNPPNDNPSGQYQQNQYYPKKSHTNTLDREVLTAPLEKPSSPTPSTQTLTQTQTQTKRKSLMKFTKKKARKTETIVQPSVVFDDDEGEVPPLNPLENEQNDDLDNLLVSYQNNHQPRSKLRLSDDEDDDTNNTNQNGISTEDDELLKLMSKKEKEIPKHTIQSYPIEKSFYIESDFIRALTTEEVRQLREHDCVRVRGKAAVKPILEWNQLGLPAPIAIVLDSLKYPSPTPIQCEALPNIMSGLDFIGIAETGSGKTIAFLLPLFRHLLSNPLRHSNTAGSTPRAIILTPTRELAIQIARAAKPFAENLNITIAKCYGGQSISGQIADLKRHADIVIGTPGRIIDLLCTNNGRILDLGHVSYFVMDEADRMLDLGFEPQIVKILHLLREDRQNVFFSATFPPKMQSIARKYTHGHVEVLVGSRNAVNENIDQRFEILLDEAAKFPKLLQILGSEELSSGKTIIFAERQNSCDQIVKQLLRRGYPVMALHGGKDQMEREGTIKDLKNGIIDIIVATSIASRGLDVDKLNLVVNYDSPSHIEDYVHRVGRTGRAGNKGIAITFLTPDQDKLAYELVKSLSSTSSQCEVPEQLTDLAAKYEAKLKSGEASLGSGFAGKGGLEKLQQIRESNFNLERKVYLDGETVSKSESTVTSSTTNKPPTLIPVEFMPYDEREHLYSAKLFINDFSQRVRMEITSREQYSRVVELTNASVTTRGRFYPPGTSAKKKQSEEDKLHVLVESPSERDVAEAISLFEESARRGLEREALALAQQ